MNGSKRPSPVSWLAVGVGYSLAATVFILGLVASELPASMELAGAVALAAVTAVPPTLALAGLTGRPALLLPASLIGLTSLPVLSVLGLLMIVLAIIWIWSYLRIRPDGGGLRKVLTTLTVWLLWAASIASLFIHIDPRCVQTLADGTVVQIDAETVGFESGWVWDVSSTTTGSSIVTADVVSEVCTSDVVTGLEAIVSLTFSVGAVATGWLITSREPADTAAPA